MIKVELSGPGFIESSLNNAVGEALVHGNCFLCMSCYADLVMEVGLWKQVTCATSGVSNILRTTNREGFTTAIFILHRRLKFKLLIISFGFLSVFEPSNALLVRGIKCLCLF